MANDNLKMNVDIDVNTSSIKTETKKVKSMMSDILAGDKSITIKADGTSAVKETKKTVDDINKTISKTNDVNIKANSKGLKKVKDEIDDVKKAIDDVNDEVIKPKVDIPPIEIPPINIPPIAPGNSSILSKMATSLKEMVNPATLAAAGMGALVVGLTKGLSAGAEFNAKLLEMQTATGSTAQEMDVFKVSATNLFSAGVGVGLDDVIEKLTQTRRILPEAFDATAVENFTKQASALEEAGLGDYNELLEAAKNQVIHFGISSEEAFANIATASQNVGGEEAIDWITEYTSQFEATKEGADAMFSAMNAGSQTAVYNLDYVLDAFKELGVRAKDGDASKALTNIGKGASAGVKVAIAEIDTLTKKLGSGDIGTKEFATNLEKSLADNKVSDSVAHQIRIGLVGTKGEDIGQKAMKEIFVGMNKTASHDASKVMETLEKNMKPKGFDQVKRELVSTFTSIFADLSNKLKPIMAKLGDTLTPIVKGIGTALSNVIDYYSEFADTLSNTGFIDTVIDTLSDLFNILGDVWKVMSPVVLWVGKVAAVFGTIFLVAVKAAVKLISNLVTGIKDVLKYFKLLPTAEIELFGISKATQDLKKLELAVKNAKVQVNIGGVDDDTQAKRETILANHTRELNVIKERIKHLNIIKEFERKESIGISKNDLSSYLISRKITIEKVNQLNADKYITDKQKDKLKLLLKIEKKEDAIVEIKKGKDELDVKSAKNDIKKQTALEKLNKLFTKQKQLAIELAHKNGIASDSFKKQLSLVTETSNKIKKWKDIELAVNLAIGGKDDESMFNLDNLLSDNKTALDDIFLDAKINLETMLGAETNILSKQREHNELLFKEQELKRKLSAIDATDMVAKNKATAEHEAALLNAKSMELEILALRVKSTGANGDYLNNVISILDKQKEQRKILSEIARIELDVSLQMYRAGKGDNTLVKSFENFAKEMHSHEQSLTGLPGVFYDFNVVLQNSITRMHIISTDTLFYKTTLKSIVGVLKDVYEYNLKMKDTPLEITPTGLMNIHLLNKQLGLYRQTLIAQDKHNARLKEASKISNESLNRMSHYVLEPFETFNLPDSDLTKVNEFLLGISDAGKEYKNEIADLTASLFDETGKMNQTALDSLKLLTQEMTGVDLKLDDKFIIDIKAYKEDPFKYMTKYFDNMIEKQEELSEALKQGSEQFYAEQKQKAMVYGEFASIFGTMSGEIIADNQKMSDILLATALKTMDMIVNLAIPKIWAEALSTQGVFGIGTATALTVMLKAVQATAHAGVGAEEGGFIDSNYNKKPGPTDTIHAMLAPNEQVIRSRVAIPNKDFLGKLNAGKSLSGYSISETGKLINRSNELSKTSNTNRSIVYQNNNTEIDYDKLGKAVAKYSSDRKINVSTNNKFTISEKYKIKETKINNSRF